MNNILFVARKCCYVFYVLDTPLLKMKFVNIYIMSECDLACNVRKGNAYIRCIFHQVFGYARQYFFSAFSPKIVIVINPDSSTTSISTKHLLEEEIVREAYF